MKKNIIAFVFLFSLFCSAHAQDAKGIKIYNPKENAEEAIAKAVEQAKAEGKNIFVQIGGNWCVWCLRFNDFAERDTQINAAIKANYVVYHLNFSPENENKKILERFGYPQRFGFPVFLILNDKGEKIHTQDSSLLEMGKSYSKEKVLAFLFNWTTKILNPKYYK
jgi:thioredoxin-related protein